MSLSSWVSSVTFSLVITGFLLCGNSSVSSRDADTSASSAPEGEAAPVELDELDLTNEDLGLDSEL